MAQWFVPVIDLEFDPRCEPVLSHSFFLLWPVLVLSTLISIHHELVSSVPLALLSAMVSDQADVCEPMAANVQDTFRPIPDLFSYTEATVGGTCTCMYMSYTCTRDGWS